MAKLLACELNPAESAGEDSCESCCVDLHSYLHVAEFLQKAHEELREEGSVAGSVRHPETRVVAARVARTRTTDDLSRVQATIPANLGKKYGSGIGRTTVAITV